MVDAYTFTSGNSMITFKTRAELYDHMISVNEVILEGDDAPKFAAHCAKRIAQNPENVKAKNALKRMEE